MYHMGACCPPSTPAVVDVAAFLATPPSATGSHAAAPHAEKYGSARGIAGNRCPQSVPALVDMGALLAPHHHDHAGMHVCTSGSRCVTIARQLPSPRAPGVRSVHEQFEEMERELLDCVEREAGRGLGPLRPLPGTLGPCRTRTGIGGGPSGEAARQRLAGVTRFQVMQRSAMEPYNSCLDGAVANVAVDDGPARRPHLGIGASAPTTDEMLANRLQIEADGEVARRLQHAEASRGIRAHSADDRQQPDRANARRLQAEWDRTDATARSRGRAFVPTTDEELMRRAIEASLRDRPGFAVPGATPEVVARATTLSLYRPGSKSLGNGADDCHICYDNFCMDEPIRVLPCLHRFHAECVDRWLAQSRICPVCKLDITSRARHPVGAR